MVARRGKGASSTPSLLARTDLDLQNLAPSNEVNVTFGGCEVGRRAYCAIYAEYTQ